MLWQVDIYPAAGQPDLVAARLAADAADLGLAARLRVAAAHGYLIEGDLEETDVLRLAKQLLADAVVERAVVAPAGDARLNQPPSGPAKPSGPTQPSGPAHAADAAQSRFSLRESSVSCAERKTTMPHAAFAHVHLVYVLPKPGVMDPVAQSALAAIADSGLHAAAVRTFRKYWLADLPDEKLPALCGKLLANDAIEQVVVGPLKLKRLEVGSTYSFELVTVPIRELDDAALERLSREGQLYLKLPEMRTIRDYFRTLKRDPTDAELETIAQTWSEHCSHKTLTGRIRYRDENGEQTFQNMLKETIFAATETVRRQLASDDWCVSVFRDNAGVVKFDERNHVVFKVETHNHPSALEPYGGANTGIGGVIRDPLGTGLGARPVCNTDVFCFAPPDTPAEELPPGVLHPKRVMRGVVSGVRDYGNRMGIPTVNGAIYFDPRYLGNPLVYCGTVGLLPCDKVEKQPLPGDYIVAVGGRTGRDGIHGATFSSAELTSESETLSGGAVQIGNAITEKMLLDVVLAARDRGLYHAITDCGAGGFSSAVGEMGEKIGAEVWLDRVPLKYEGLSYTEIWISEAQERMVLAVPPDRWPEFSQLCASEWVEATVIGEFVPTGRLQLKYHDHVVADLAMEFLHDGRPPVVREALFEAPKTVALQLPERSDYTPTLIKILSSLNVSSKEWVIRQYDHEVQGGSVVKPLVGANNDGPSDAAVLRPVLGSRRGIVMACGMNPRYGDFDTYHMAASAIDEAMRNCVAVGADPRRIAILDNFCWGDTDRPETLGSLVRAALACRDMAIALGVPFISGKDSLNNEFRYTDSDGTRRSLAIPPSLLISALGQIDDVARAVTMDLKAPGNWLYLVGETRDELGGSHFSLVESLSGGKVPSADAERAKRTFLALHGTIRSGLVRACHDLSEGGLAVAAAEMAFAGGYGAKLQLDGMPCLPTELSAAGRLFSESNTRFLCEVPREKSAAFEAALQEIPHARLGEVCPEQRLEISFAGATIISGELATLKEAWQAPLRW